MRVQCSVCSARGQILQSEGKEVSVLLCSEEIPPSPPASPRCSGSPRRGVRRPPSKSSPACHRPSLTDNAASYSSHRLLPTGPYLLLRACLPP